MKTTLFLISLEFFDTDNKKISIFNKSEVFVAQTGSFVLFGKTQYKFRKTYKKLVSNMFENREI